MTTWMLWISLLTSAFVPGGRESVTLPECCVRGDSCCEAGEACCPQAVHGAAAQADPQLATNACCVKRAWCCKIGLPCCGKRQHAQQTDSTHLAAVDNDLPTTPHCCVKRAWCCVIKAACCQGTSAAPPQA